jgi:hypothetical protein
MIENKLEHFAIIIIIIIIFIIIFIINRSGFV